MLIDIGASPDEGLRLLPTPDSGFLLAVGSELRGDLVVEYEGYKVLLVGIEYFDILDGATVDCRDAKDGPALFIEKYL